MCHKLELNVSTPVDVGQIKDYVYSYIYTLKYI
jgi:hypothetical protein